MRNVEYGLLAVAVLLLISAGVPGRAAEQGTVENLNDPDVEAGIATSYADPKDGRMADPVEAERWYLDAAMHGDPNAAAALGRLYLHGGGGLERDFGQARYWLAIAARAGIPQAQFDLGVIYAEGLGTGYDWPLAKRWLETAARHGSREAESYLATHMPK